MESFYGGKRGFSFILARSFSSEQEMINNFKKGLDYKEVNYEEYVLIDTPNKTNPENGRIYRRGRDFTNAKGGAEFIGAIVGPAGQPPIVKMTTTAEVKNKYNSGDKVTSTLSEGAYTVPNSSLVPGKTSSGSYNDSIKWAVCSIVLEDGRKTEAWLGFEFPYLVVDFSADSVSPYYNRNNQTNNFTNQNLINRIDSGSHPFWENWNIKIPKGIKGDSFKNFRVVTASTAIQEYDGRADDISSNRKVLVYDYYHYDKLETGEPTTIYLGDFNMISDLAFDEDGTVTIQYTHDNTTTYSNLFKWIKSITLNKDTGHFKIEYNYTSKNGTPTVYETDLTWVKDIIATDDGKVELHYSTGGTKELNSKIKWIKDIVLSEQGVLSVTYNDNSVQTFNNKIKWIDSIKLDKDGTFSITYNDEVTQTFADKIKWLNDINLDPNGTFSVTYNDETIKTFADKIKWIKNISLNSDGTFSITFNDDKQQVFTDKIKWINDISLNPDGTFSITYNDNVTQTFDDKIKWIDDINLNKNGTFSVTFNDNVIKTFDDKIKWINDITFGEDGTFSITYNDDTTQVFDDKVKWVNKVILEDNGTLRITYNDKTEEVFDESIKWITNVLLNEDGTFTVSYNHGDDYTPEHKIKWISNINLSDAGQFTIQYNDGSPDYTKTLRWVEEASVTENGDLTFTYNDDTETKYEKYLKTIKNVTVDEESQKLHIEYNTGTDELIGDPFNSIAETAITADYHFVLYYTDPALRKKIVDEGLAYPREFQGKTDWLDLGSIKSDSGVLIGLNITKTELGSLTAIDYLNQEYPVGLIGDLKGKVVTVGDSDDSKTFYAFDYNTYSDGNYKGWYSIGNLINFSQFFIIGKEDAEDIELKKNNLQNGGIWFVTEEIVKNE